MIKGNITISRVRCSHGPDYIAVSLGDSDARIKFADAKVSLEDFAKLITGQGYIDCEIEVRGLDYVGKVRETKPVILTLPEGVNFTEEKNVASQLLKDNEEDGWVNSTYLGAKGAIFSDNGKRYVRSTASRWVPKEEPIETE